jgi:DNA-binding SARP family transcriptional activator
VERRRVAGTLWPVGDDARSAGNLRSALWRLKRAGLPLITADKQCLTIRSDVIIDDQLVSRWTTRLIHGHPSAQDLATVPGGVDELDLLPGWYDDWVLYERERQRQRLLHALESLTDLLVVEGQHAEAVDAAMVAIGAEPLRETAHLALMRAHRAEGNWVEVRRSYQVYRDLLWRELGVEPGRAVTELARRPSPQPYPVGSVRSAPA